MIISKNTRVITTIEEMKIFRKSLRGTVGFIPTMGYLHDGHLSLAKRAKQENDKVIVSVFVNPKQFGPQEDFLAYPRDTERDMQLLETVPVDAVFLPSIDELYPFGFETYVNVEQITRRLEGAIRPDHFKGVTTVVSLLFNIIQPDRTYFGQKDAQQVVVVQKMVSDLHIPIEIIVCPTIREPDGLAMSSRNVYLTSKERKEAPVLFQSLTLAKKLFYQGEKDAKKIKSKMQELIKKTRGVIDYISIADSHNLTEQEVVSQDSLISLAVRFGNIRLIDNILLNS